jgi:acyl carrier protein
MLRIGVDDGPGTAVVSVDAAVTAVGDMLRARRGDGIAVDARTRLRDIGLDSLDAAELIVVLEEMVGLELDQESLEGVETVGDLTRVRPLHDLTVT